MDETRFIKTVAFGGFDKTDVLNHLEKLNSQVYGLKNELRDAKYLLEAYRSGSSTEKACEAALAEERNILSKYQVANETLSTKLTDALEETNSCQQRIKAMKKEIDDLNAKLKSSKDMIIALQAGTEAAALGNVFIEAQKASDMLVGEAKSKSAQINYDAKKAAEETISGANKTAEKIIREAEQHAANAVAEAEKKVHEMAEASNTVRSAVTQNAEVLARGIGTLKYLLDELNKLSASNLGQSEKMLADMTDALKGEVPDINIDMFFTKPAEEADASAPALMTENTPMAESIDDDAKSASDKIQDNNSDHTAKNINAKNAQADNQGKNKKGKIDLAALAAQANALNKKK